MKEKVEEKLKELKEAGTNHLSPTDPDARMMKNHEGTRFAYNAQIAVDSKSGIILAQNVINRADDSKELVGMIEKSVENTGVSADQITTVADGGYAASAGLVKADEKGFNVLVNRSRGEIKKLDSPFHQQNFTYDEDSDSFQCPYGGRLVFSSISKKTGTNDEVRRYKCNANNVLTGMPAARIKQGVQLKSMH